MTVSGLLLLSRPEDQHAVIEDLGALGWATVHATDAGGRLLVTIEAASTDEAVARHLLIQALPGVIAADMVEHYAGDDIEHDPGTVPGNR